MKDKAACGRARTCQELNGYRLFSTAPFHISTVNQNELNALNATFVLKLIEHEVRARMKRYFRRPRLHSGRVSSSLLLLLSLRSRCPRQQLWRRQHARNVRCRPYFHTFRQCLQIGNGGPDKGESLVMPLQL